MQQNWKQVQTQEQHKEHVDMSTWTAPEVFAFIRKGLGADRTPEDAHRVFDLMDADGR